MCEESMIDFTTNMNMSFAEINVESVALWMFLYELLISVHGLKFDLEEITPCTANISA